MMSKLSTSALVLVAARLAAAQTSSACNPVEGDTCPDDTAFGTTVEIDFTQGASDYFDVAAGTTLTYDDDKGAVFTINSETDAPTVTSNDYLFFGVVEVVMQAAPGQGIVSSFVLESDCLDEIDWEFVGSDYSQAQSNYFHQGNDTTYDRGGYHNVTNPQDGFHTYSMDWTAERLIWSIDGVAVRTLTYDDAYNGKTYPQTPMQIKLGNWVAGSSTASEGTVEWAGGLASFDNDASYLGYYKSVKITNYSNNVTSASSYTYSGTSGTYDSIVVNTGNTTDSTSSTSSESSSTTSSSTSTKSGSSNSTSTLVTASETATSTGSSSSTSSTGSSTSSSVTTNAAGQMGASLFGAALAALAALALM